MNATFAPVQGEGMAGAFQRFANPRVVSEGWYVLARSKRLAKGATLAESVGGRDVVVYRGLDGVARTLDARCGHLGARLDRGRVTPEGLECVFHGWCWDSEGDCARAPGQPALPQRRVQAYATTERWGLVWAWLGARPAFPLPHAGAPDSWRVVRLPPQRIRCHPHLVLGNGYDLAHLGPLHGFELTREPSLKVDAPHRMSLDVEGRLPSRLPLRLFRLAGKRFEATFSTHGPSIHHVHVRAPIEFRIVFTGRPDAAGACDAQTLLFVPRRLWLARVLALLWNTTIEDMRMMEALEFRPAFTESDWALAAYARLVGAMPLWTNAADSEAVKEVRP